MRLVSAVSAGAGCSMASGRSASSSSSRRAVRRVDVARQPRGRLRGAAGRPRIDGPDRLEAPIAVVRAAGLDRAGLLPGQQARRVAGRVDDDGPLVGQRRRPRRSGPRPARPTAGAARGSRRRRSRRRRGAPAGGSAAPARGRSARAGRRRRAPARRRGRAARARWPATARPASTCAGPAGARRGRWPPPRRRSTDGRRRRRSRARARGRRPPTARAGGGRARGAASRRRRGRSGGSPRRCAAGSGKP